MVQQWGDLFGRIQARRPGRLQHYAGVFQDLLFGALLQLATNDVCSPENLKARTGIKTRLKKIRSLKVRIKEATQVANSWLCLASNRIGKWQAAPVSPTSYRSGS